MARLSTYTSDTVDKSDKLIGTSSGGETKNFVISDISTFLANTNAAGVAGQITYQYKASSGDKASGTFLGTFSSGSTFANLTSIKVSKYPADSSLSVVNLLTSYNNNQIILSSINHPDNFGVYSISNVAQDGSSDYYDITVGFVSGNGSLSNDNYYGINSTSIVASAYATLTGTQVLTNKTLTSPVLNTGVSGTAIKDEDDMSSNSATHLATQQSIKAYVDNQLTASDLDFQGDSGGALSIDLDSETLTLAGGTGLTSTGSSNTITFAVDAAQTGITSIYATDLILGEDSQTAIDFGTANEIDFKVDNAARLTLTSSALYPVTNNQIDLGTSSLEFKDAYFDGTVTADAFAGPLTGDVTGNVSGTAATVTGSAQSNITSLGTLTTLTVDNVIINGTTIGHTGDTDLMTVASGVLTVAGEVDATSLDISGDADIDGTLEADAITVDGTALDTHIAGVTVTNATNATNAAHALVTDNENTNEDNPITFVEGATTSTGNIGLEMDGDFHYNPSTGRLTASQLAGTLQTASQTNITGVGTISTGVWNGTAVASAYLDSDTMHLSVAQTITGEKTIDGSDKFYFRDSAIYLHSDADGYLEMVADTGVSLKIGSTEQVILTDGAFTPTSDSDVDLGSSSKYWKDSYIDSITTTGNVVVGGNLTVSGTTTTVNSTTVAIADSMLKLAKDQADTADAVDFGFYGQYGDSGTHKYAGIFRDLSASGDPWTFFDGLQAEPGTTVNTSGTGYDLADISAGGITSADGFTGTLLTAAQGNVTSLGTLTTLTVDNVIINGTTIGHTSDTDLITLADGVFTVAGEIDGASLDIEGNADINGTTNLDDVDIDGNVQIDGTLTVGVDDTGYDVKLFGATSGDYILWDESDNELETAGGATINIIKDKLKIGGTAVTTTAAELNFLDTAAANTVVNSKAVIYGSSGELAGTLSTAAQGNVTSLGTLSTLTVDNVIINATTIGHTSDTDLLTLASGALTVAGTVRMGTSTETANTNFDDLVIENVAGHSGITIFSKSDSDGAIYFGDVEANNLGQIKYLHGSNAMTFATNDGSASLTLDSGTDATFAGDVTISGGHLGLSGFPRTDLHATWNQMFIGSKGSLISENGSGGIAGMTVSDNLYIDSDTGTYAYLTTNEASQLTQEAGILTFKNAASGTAGNAPTLTERFKVDASGNATFAGSITTTQAIIAGSADDILTLNQTGTDTGWSYINFNTSGTRQYYVGMDSGKNFNIYNDNTDVLVLSLGYSDNSATFGGVVGINGSTTANVPLTATTSSGYEDVAYFKSAGTNIDSRINLIPTGTGGGVLNASANNLELQVAGSFMALINSSGNLGLGTSTIRQRFHQHVGDGGANYHAFTNTETGTASTDGSVVGIDDAENLLLWQQENLDVRIGSAGSDRIRVKNDGKVGIGTTSPGELLHVSGSVDNDDIAIKITNSSDDDSSSTRPSVALMLDVTSNNAHLRCWNAPADTSANHQIDLGSTAGDSFITFSPNNTEMMRIDSAGRVGISKTPTTTYESTLQIETHNGSNTLELNQTATTNRYFVIVTNPNGAIGSIQGSGTTTTYNTTSDYRLKEDLRDFNGLDLISKIPVYDFKWKLDDTRSYGVIAHELAEVLPNAVAGEKDDKEMQQADYSKLVPILLKATQEQQEIIEDLKKRIETLEK